MKIDHRIEDDICIVNINGDMTRDYVKKFQTYMEPFIENESIKGIALNFANVKFIDSSGIGKIVTIFRLLQSREAKLKIYNINQKDHEIFKMTGLDKIWDLQRTEEEVLKKLKGNYEN